MSQKDPQATSSKAEVDEFTVVFKDEALEKMRELADFLNIPRYKLGDVLVKGLHLLDIVKSQHKSEIIMMDKKECIKVDLKKL